MKNKTVTLNESVEINGKKTKKITLREPKAGELRGLNLVDVVSVEMTSIVTLTTRVSDLTETQMINMGAPDLLLIGATIASFFAPASESQSA